MRWKYRLTNRRLSLMPSSARPKRVEEPRKRASWPSAESKMSETMNSTNPITLVQRSWYPNRWPATSPIKGDHRLILVDHQGRIDANLGVVDHREHAAGQQRVEDPAGGLLVEQLARPGNDEVHPDHEAAPPHVRHDRQ